MIVVDSSVWIDYFIGRMTPAAEKLDSLLGEAPIAAGCIENRLPLLYSDKDFQPFQKHLKLQSAL